jgi:hypothetical protein
VAWGEGTNKAIFHDGTSDHLRMLRQIPARRALTAMASGTDANLPNIITLEHATLVPHALCLNRYSLLFSLTWKHIAFDFQGERFHRVEQGRLADEGLITKPNTEINQNAFAMTKIPHRN